MSSIITHSFVGLLGAKIFARPPMSKGFWVLAAVSPVLPDADVIAFLFGIPYGHPLGHRGFFHSIAFSLLLSVFLATILFYRQRVLSGKWFYLVLTFFIINASHGVLDAFTNGGLGIALMAPFDDARYFSPWRPIQVSPIGIRAFFSGWGFSVMLSELLWVWLPLLMIFWLVRIIRRKNTPKLIGSK